LIDDAGALADQPLTDAMQLCRRLIEAERERTQALLTELLIQILRQHHQTLFQKPCLVVCVALPSCPPLRVLNRSLCTGRLTRLDRMDGFVERNL
jgi:hypothetical protein